LLPCPLHPRAGLFIHDRSGNVLSALTFEAPVELGESEETSVLNGIAMPGYGASDLRGPGAGGHLIHHFGNFVISPMSCCVGCMHTGGVACNGIRNNELVGPVTTTPGWRPLARGRAALGPRAERSPGG
ncbi:hypothetical protein B0H10DRAFT_1954155, partial [Mycena sp. CBHHK59/15]